MISTPEPQYDELMEMSPNWISLFDSDGRFMRTNSSGLAAIGYSESDLIDKHFTDIWPDDTRQTILDCIAQALENEHSWFEAEMARPDGRMLSWHATLSLHTTDGDDPQRQVVMIATDITARRQAEKDARDTENRYRSMFESFSDVYVRTNSAGRVVEISPSITEMTGYSVSECIGRQGADFFVDPDEIRSLRKAILKTGFVNDYQTLLVAKDGSRLVLSCSARAVYDHNGRLRYLDGVLRDITERKRTEQQTQDLLHRYELLFKHARDIMIFFRWDGGIVEANDAAVKAYGYTRDELFSKNIADLQVDRDAPALADLLEDTECTGILFETIHRRKNGDTFPVEVSWQTTKIGNEWILLNIIRDITERKATEGNLRIHTSAMNAAGDQIVIINAAGLIEFVNPAFERETGYLYEEVLGRNLRFLESVEDDDKQYEELWESIVSGRTWHGEIVNRRKDGSICTEEVTITPVRSALGSIEHFIAIKRNITEKKLYEARLDHLAHHDHLTGLPNRLMISNTLTRKLEEAQHNESPIGIMFLDLDRFKIVNDTLGHNIGDAMLKEAAERIKKCLHEEDTLARMGGDEFIIILSDIRGPNDAALMAQRILDTLAKPFELEQHELFMTASIGISLYPDHGTDVETLVKNSDTAMYRAKEQGRNNCQFYTEALNAVAFQRMKLETSLRKALERNEFAAYYQPHVDLRTKEVLGVEALIRWQHPELGLLTPNHFITLAEETGLIVPMSHWMLYEACRQNRQWQDEGFPPIKVAVNISPRLFQQDGLVGTINRVLLETDLEARYLELEITESTLMQNPDLATRILGTLKSMGVRISIDDFGTGYSSLGRLKQLPIDILKIDRSFIRDIPMDPDDMAIAEAIVAMAHSLHLKVIAEGVETLDQLDFLQSIGCDEVQGYFISRPSSAGEFKHLMRESERTTPGMVAIAA